MFFRSYNYVHYSEQDKEIILETPESVLLVLFYFSVFIENGYVQHAGTEYVGVHNQPYHAYFVSDEPSYKLKYNLLMRIVYQLAIC